MHNYLVDVHLSIVHVFKRCKILASFELSSTKGLLFRILSLFPLSLSLHPGSGIYHNLKKYNLPYPEAIFDISYFRQNPRPFNTWAKEFFPGVKYKPNIAHFFVKLLHDKGKLTRLYTQVIIMS